MVINYLLTGMILQVGGWNPWRIFCWLFIGVVTPFGTGRGLPCRTSFRITKEIRLNSNGPTIEVTLRIMGSQQVVISRS